MLDIIFEEFAKVDTWTHDVPEGMIKAGYIQQVWRQVIRTAVEEKDEE